MLTILILALSAGTALAADGSVTGSVTILNPAPQVTEAGLWIAPNSSVEAMDPGVAYSLTMYVKDENSFKDIKEIYVTMKTVSGAQTDWDSDQNVIFKWKPEYVGQNSVNGWDRYTNLDPASGPITFKTTWEITHLCNAPDLNAKEGLFTLGFKPGLIAQAGGWYIKIRAIDNENHASDLYVLPTSNGNTVTMNRSIAMRVLDGPGGSAIDKVNFGSLVPGGASITVPLYPEVTTNAAFSMRASTSATWTGAGSNAIAPVTATPADNQFLLGIDDSLDNWGYLTTKQPLTASSQIITDWGNITPSASEPDGLENSATPSDLWMIMDLGPEIPTDIYSGTVTFTAQNN